MYIVLRIFYDFTLYSHEYNVQHMHTECFPISINIWVIKYIFKRRFNIVINNRPQVFVLDCSIIRTSTQGVQFVFRNTCTERTRLCYNISELEAFIYAKLIYAKP